MSHFYFSNLLPAFMSGELKPREVEGLRGHLRDCDECSEWVATYRLLTSVLAESSFARSEKHLSSLELAEAARGAARSKDLGEHLEACHECSEEVRIAQAAIVEGRREPDERRSAVQWRRLSWLRVAAVLAVLAAGFTLGERFLAREDGTKFIQGAVLRGTQTLEARDALLLERTVVERRAIVKMEAGDVVAFGEGVSIGSDVNLEVGTRGLRGSS